MITIQRSSGGALKYALTGTVLVALGLAVWGLMSEDKASPMPAPAGVAPTASMPTVVNSDHLVEPADSGASDMSDTSALGKAMSAQPNGKAQLNRVLNFLKFQRDFEKWQSMQGDGDLSVRMELGMRLIQSLPEHIANANMTLPEGEFVCGMILSDIENNETLRDSGIQSCQAKLKSFAPKMDTEQDRRKIECESDYRSREATLVQAFQAMPSTQRDPDKLQADLDKAKHDVFSLPDCKL